MIKEILKKDILLAFIDLSIEKQNILSPIQLMKGMFLVKNELKISNFYKFEAYLYGPCSFEIYSDLIDLLENKLIDAISTPFSWKYYRTTNVGSNKANLIIKKLDKKNVEKLNEIKKLVITKSFLELLEYVYKKYPEYAKNSIVDLGVFEKWH